MRRAAAFANGLLSVALLAALSSCGGIGPGSDTDDEGSAEEHAALEAFFEDPVFRAEPPSTGQVLEEAHEAACREISHEPGASRTYELLSDGQDVAAFYEEQASEHGWQLVEERPIDPNAPFMGRRASLYFERPEGDFTLSMWVDFGLGLTAGRPTVSVGGGVEDVSFCS